MSDFVYFICWFACINASALCIAGPFGDYLHFQSAVMSLLLPLCLSVLAGSCLFLMFLKLRVQNVSIEASAKGINGESVGDG